MSHTPGPWKILRHDLGDEEIFVVPVEIRGGNGKLIVAYDGGLAPLEQEWIVEEIEANASLIAAAPEMLAILEELRESASYWSEYDVPLGIVERIESAIRKARGEE